MNKRTSVLSVLSVIALGALSTTSAMGEAPPDSDNDGTSDVADKCPNLPGHANSPVGTGCPCTIGLDTPDADCDGIPDSIDRELDYGPSDYDDSGGTDTDGDGNTDDNDDSSYGENDNAGDSSSGGDGGDTGTGTVGAGTGNGGGTGTDTDSVVDPWREYCADTRGIWEPDQDWWRESGWCRYPGEVLGDCWVDVSQMPDHIRARYNITHPGPFEHLFQYYARDRCRHRRGHWYPYR